jgi:uncharacterized protein (DUF433 family)
MDAKLENLTTNEAAVVAGVTVAEINRAIDRKILPTKLYDISASRTLRKDACLWIAFYFETAGSLKPSARLKAIQKAIEDGFDRGASWRELRSCRVAESRAVEVCFGRIWEDVDRRWTELQEAREMVVEDPEILRGTPVIKGTRIPVYDVASVVDAGTPAQELATLYPRLDGRHFELASLYAKANPRRGRPKRRSLPKSAQVAVSRIQARNAS